MYYGIYSLKPYKDRVFYAWAIWLKKHRIRANHITLSGLFLGLFAAVCLLAKLPFWGLIFIFLSVGADMLDGTLARVSNSVQLSGKLCDAICDRLVEIAWVSALVYRRIILWWGWALPVASILLLIARCWAYQRKLKTSFVLVTRFERVLVMLLAVIIPWHFVVIPIYVIVTIGTLFSTAEIVLVVIFQPKYNPIMNYRHHRDSDFFEH